MTQAMDIDQDNSTAKDYGIDYFTLPRKKKFYKKIEEINKAIP